MLTLEACEKEIEKVKGRMQKAANEALLPNGTKESRKAAKKDFLWQAGYLAGLRTLSCQIA